MSPIPNPAKIPKCPTCGGMDHVDCISDAVWRSVMRNAPWYVRLKYFISGFFVCEAPGHVDGCPWCDSKEHWSGRVELCPSRASLMVTKALESNPAPGESWHDYALRLRQQLSDEAERVA